MAKILVICSRTPFPPIGGAKLRMYNMAKILATKHTVDLLIIDKAGNTPDNFDELKSEFNNVAYFTYPERRFLINASQAILSDEPFQTHYFHFDEVQSWVQDNVSSYDLFYCNHIRTTKYLSGLGVKKVVDFVDAISRNYLRANRSGVWRIIHHVEGRRLRNYESTVSENFSHCFIISKSDMEFIQQGSDGCDNISVIPNGVRTELLEKSFTDQQSIDRSTIVFLGKMDYFPNEDAVCYFANSIFPLVRKNFPDANFRIVGMNPTSKVKKLQKIDGVEVTGFVKEPATELNRASVAVAPMRQGAGLQNKVLEAMALSKPVVASSVAKDGIDATDGTHLCVADEPEQFARKLVELLSSPDMRARIGSNALQLIENKYQWEIIKPQLLNHIKYVLNKNKRRK